MSEDKQIDIYVGKTARPDYSSKNGIFIPSRWKPLLALAYAYTSSTVNNTFIDFYALSNLVNEHEDKLNIIADDLASISTINNSDFISKINNIAGKIDNIDPDLLLGLAYSYVIAGDHDVYNSAYAYSYSLYTTGINRSYDKINNIYNSLNDDINDIYIYINDNYVTGSYISDTYAVKSDIPSKVSQLDNDSRFITHNALDNYATVESVDRRIESIINNAPENLDTLKEIADALDNNENLASYLTNKISEKADLSYVTDLYNRTSAQNNDIPIYDDVNIQSLIDAGELPDKYISVPSTETILQQSQSGKYLDIIFSAIRSLQQQVSKMQRTFNKGLISLTNEKTHMSDVLEEYSSVEETEPMWAVDPSSLTEIPGSEFYLDTAHTLEPSENVTVSTNKLIISQHASWSDNHVNITTNKPTNLLYDCEDSKEYVYITASAVNIVITLTSYYNDEDNITIDLGSLHLPVTEAHKYNILVCVSRAVKNGTRYVGNNFIFISIGDYFTGNTIWEKYYNKNNNTFSDGWQTLNMPINYLENEKNRYFISDIEFSNLELYKMKFYSKFQDFGNDVNNNDVQPSIPDDDDTYSVAHITIRSVKSLDQLKKIKNQLLENELVYNDNNNCIYIIKNNTIKLISGGSSIVDPSDDISGMEKTEILEWLQENGIIGLVEDPENENVNISFNNIGDITFINQLNEKYRFFVDTDGNLKSAPVNDSSLKERLAVKNITINENTGNYVNTRGFVGTLREYETGERIAAGGNIDKDMRLNSDRIKIGNVYAPFKDSAVHGCTHGYIELENTSDLDFELDGCYIHFARKLNDDSVEEFSLPLTGVIHGGSTYLIRCKKYSDIDQANTFINVDSFDIEWVTVDGELLDIYLGVQNDILLTYGCPGKDRDPESTFDYTVTMTAAGTGTELNYKVYHPCYIDSIAICNYLTIGDGTGYSWCGWAADAGTSGTESKGYFKNANKLDALYKTTFELDPAKQAYQGLHWKTSNASGKDSSRVRSNTATDYQTVYLQKEYIEFPNSDEKYPVAMYKPMASYLHKNVCTDKTKLDTQKPNMVTVAFGINMLTTRCFNWISAGKFDEYIWIRKAGDNAWGKPFESYKQVNLTNNEDTNYNTYKTKKDNNQLTAPYRKEFTYITNNAVYARISKTFPGCGIHYTAHKCIIEIVDEPVENVTEYEYIVGRGDKNLNPDPEHTSNIMKFTLYPASYEPRLYQTTDQQGFHWIEYQTWAAAANKINGIIEEQCANDNIIPVILNTGDATQNGTRINEWLDYYIGGKNLFNHLEQMSIVGNNDLCGNDPEILGTGDDNGKSNGFYHHVFYCYEVDEKLADDTYIDVIDAEHPLNFNNISFKYLPLVNGEDNIIRYIPSFYWFGTDKYTFVMMNSELTYINCGEWFKRKLENHVVNLYTGWTIKNSNDDASYVPQYDDNLTTVYTMLYNIINEHKINKESSSAKIENLIVACHEMPFTVITAANLKNTKINGDRSINNSTSLVGSHMNMMSVNDIKSNYWFSRLLEHFNVKFVYGGHKHIYAITNEVRENYIYEQNNIRKFSVIDGKMPMFNTLKNDTAEFIYKLKEESDGHYIIDTNVTNESTGSDLKVVALSKYPVMNKKDVDINIEDGITSDIDVVFPYYGITLDDGEDLGGIIYMMCQATGFKLKSNKELPGPNQKFSFIIPKTTPATVSYKTDTPSNQQLLPMFAEIHPDNKTAYLIRLLNIHKGNPDTTTPKVLTQTDYGTGEIKLQYLHREENIDMYGAWSNDKKVLLTW